MADLNISNLNKKSEKYIFKNKLTLKSKSKRKLIIESLYMLIISSLIFYLNYLIPNKTLIFRNLSSNFESLLIIFIELLSYIFQIFLAAFIIISIFLKYVNSKFFYELKF